MSNTQKPDSGYKTTIERFRSAWPHHAWRDVTTLAGVSGGADSVAMLRLMREMDAHSSGGGALIVAHFDHGWRDDSARDAEFVASLSDELGLQCVIGCAADAAIDAVEDVDVVASEERARASRYAFLIRAAKQHGARFVAVAHTADDQVETILHHVIRGTGLRGLAGVPRSRSIDESVSLVRPMLGFRRTQLVEYLQSVCQEYLVDPANSDSRYTRARIRHELLPHLREYNAEVDESILRLGSLALEASAEISRVAQERLPEALVTSTPTSAVLSIPRLAGASPFLVREMFIELWRRQRWPMQAMTHKTWLSLAEMVGPVDSATRASARDLPGGVTVRRGENGELEIQV